MSKAKKSQKPKTPDTSAGARRTPRGMPRPAPVGFAPGQEVPQQPIPGQPLQVGRILNLHRVRPKRGRPRKRPIEE